jgi:hypothetical protein
MSAEGVRDIVAWYDVLDVFAGHRRYRWMETPLAKGLQMARQCHHADAQWLAALFPRSWRVSGGTVEKVLRMQFPDSRAAYLVFLLFADHDDGGLRDAAESGYAPAMSLIARAPDRPWSENERWAKKAAAKQDRHAFYWLWVHRWEMRYTPEAALELLKGAAELYHTKAMFRYGWAQERGERYCWWALGATRCHHKAIATLEMAARSHLDAVRAGGCGRICFEIGAACHAHFDRKRRTLFGHGPQHGMASMRETVRLYRCTCAKARAAIACWACMARLSGVVKDVRQMIAHMLWDEKAAWGCEKCPQHPIVS